CVRDSSGWFAYW
nr:immunoglobulin heavy chain junction region [Mus musculus]